MIYYDFSKNRQKLKKKSKKKLPKVKKILNTGDSESGETDVKVDSLSSSDIDEDGECSLEEE